MPQDAFTLRHIARELNAMLSGGKVNKIIQPSRDEVDLLFYAGGKTRKLMLNTNASFARACVSELPRTAPDIAPNFCMLLRKHLTGATPRGNLPAPSACCMRKSWASTPTSCSPKAA